MDVSIEEDLVEEIVRTKGYDAIPETLPRNAVDTPVEPPEAQAIARVRAALEGAGFAEAVNFSFVAARELAPFGAHVSTGDGSGRALGIALKNPISADLSVMRTSLVPSLLKNAAHNRRQRVEDVRLYELASVYHPHPDPKDRPSAEAVEVAGVLAGRRSPAGWASPATRRTSTTRRRRSPRPRGARHRGDVARARRVVAPPPDLRPVACGAEVLGEVGELHPRVAAAFELPRGVLAFRLSLDALLRRRGSSRSTGPSRGSPRCCATSRSSSTTRPRRPRSRRSSARSRSSRR